MDIREKIVQQGVEITPRVERSIKDYEQYIKPKGVVSEKWFIGFIKEFAASGKPPF